MIKENRTVGIALIALVAIAACVAILMLDPIAQPQGYHAFSDEVAYLSIPNALNVLSNLPFLLVGVAGLLALRKRQASPLKIIEENRLAYFCLFLGSALVGIGSAYYHLSPDNGTLVWDRLPMTIAFMGLYSIIIGEFVSCKMARLSLSPLVLLGIGSVLYWSITEQSGSGDLRLYGLVQFFPILTIPVMLIFFKSRYTDVRAYWILMASYIAAKLFEEFDTQIHDVLGLISGHSIKHVFPAIGLYILLGSYKNRTELQ